MSGADNPSQRCGAQHASCWDAYGVLGESEGQRQRAIDNMTFTTNLDLAQRVVNALHLSLDIVATQQPPGAR